MGQGVAAGRDPPLGLKHPLMFTAKAPRNAEVARSDGTP